jgi:23S rRNA (uracil1939-C5)-methyltransferase
MDPPRAGSDKKFLSSLLKTEPKRIVYISCDPETMARDLGILTEQRRYKVKKIQPVDMFPFTEHVETVVLMSRVDR